jgi:hypothetical protein
MSSSSSPKAYKSPSFSLNGLDEQQSSAMPLINRAAGRNIHVYDGSDTETVLGGMFLTAGVTNSNFYAMVGVLFIFFFLRIEQPLLPGKYFIVSESQFINCAHINIADHL